MKSALGQLIVLIFLFLSIEAKKTHTRQAEYEGGGGGEAAVPVPPSEGAVEQGGEEADKDPFGFQEQNFPEGPNFPGYQQLQKLYQRAMAPFLMQMLGQGQSPFFYGNPQTKNIQPSAYAKVDARNGPIVLNPTPSDPSDPIIVYGPQPQVPLVPLYPPPPPAVVLEEEQCEFDEFQNRCCNRLLKATMKAALAPLPIDTCDIGLMAKLVQEKAEAVFKMDFESLAGYKDFILKSHHVGNMTCKIERHGKRIQAYASPNEENANPQKRMDRLAREAEERLARDKRTARIKKELAEKRKQEEERKARKARRKARRSEKRKSHHDQRHPTSSQFTLEEIQRSKVLSANILSANLPLLKIPETRKASRAKLVSTMYPRSSFSEYEDITESPSIKRIPVRTVNNTTTEIKKEKEVVEKAKSHTLDGVTGHEEAVKTTPKAPQNQTVNIKN